MERERRAGIESKVRETEKEREIEREGERERERERKRAMIICSVPLCTMLY